jgi:Kef-type K+ transport system membrane component KefB
MTAAALTIPAFFGALAILIVAAHLGGFVARRARLPSVVGELGAGIALAVIPSDFLRSLRAEILVNAFGELGVMLLMFDIGLELKTSDLRRVGVSAFFVASIGVVGSLGLVALASVALGASSSVRGDVFVGATLAATSMGIAGRVLREFGKTQSREGRVVLAAAVLDDVMSLLLLAFASALVGAPGAAPEHASLGVITIRAVSFLVVAITVGRVLLPRGFRLAAKVAGDGALVVFGLAVCLAYGWAASFAGLAPVIGAFCAGLVIQPEDYRPLAATPGESLEDLLGPLLAFFVPVFFLLAGLKVDVEVFLEPRVWLLTFALFVAAAAGKLLAGLGAGRPVSRLVVGVSMIPRGEVSLIFATAGMSLGESGAPLVPKATFNAIVITVVATALLPPFALRRLFSREPRSDKKGR